jgi:hypothetical protein
LRDTRGDKDRAPSISARDIVRDFVATDSRTYGGFQPAERALARRLGVSPGTICNLIYGGMKRVCVDFYAKLKAEEIRCLSNSLAKAGREINVACSIGIDPRSPEFLALEAAGKAAREVMEKGGAAWASFAASLSASSA